MVSTIVVMGVGILSFAGCQMLGDTLRDIGVSAYIMGNFAVHYWPWLRLYYSHDHAQCETFASQAMFALTFPVVYIAMTPAGSVYGCAVSERAVSAISASSVIAVGAAYLAFRRSKRQSSTDNFKL